MRISWGTRRFGRFAYGVTHRSDRVDEAARDSVATTLYAAAEGLRILSVLLNPVMPKACASLWSQLGAEAALGSLASQRIQDCGQWGLLPAGSVLTKGDSLFPRLEDPEEFSS